MKQRVSLMFVLGALLAVPALASADEPSAPPAQAPDEAAAPEQAAEPAPAQAAGQDDDGDGVPNATDECPTTPKGAKVLPDGCTLRSDCRKPRTGEPADEKGCAIEKVYVLHGVKFEFDSDRLTQDAKGFLTVIANAMKAYPELKFELHGHTCWIGSAEYNQGLSERRARSAMAFLVQHGVKAERITAQGFGESKPIDTNETKAGREFNRRVELKVIE